MIINQKKSKVLIFNFTDNYQLTTPLELKGENIAFGNNGYKRKRKILSTVFKYRKT